MKSHDQLLVHLNLVLLFHLLVFELSVFCRLFTEVFLSCGNSLVKEVPLSFLLLNLFLFFIHLHLLMLVLSSSAVVRVLDILLLNVDLKLRFFNLALILNGFFFKSL